MLMLTDTLKTDLEPVEVLIFYDMPRLFTAKAGEGLVLVSWCDEVEGIDRYLVAPTSESLVADLCGRRLTLREALDVGLVWVVDQGESLNLVETTTLSSFDSRFPVRIPCEGVYI